MRNYNIYYKIYFFTLGPFTGKGVSSQGFKYQVPYSNVHPMAPYSGNPFTAAYGPGGPYYQQGAGDASTQPTLQNYTQFGPHPFGKYMESTVVDISLNSFSFKPVLLALPRSPLF